MPSADGPAKVQPGLVMSTPLSAECHERVELRVFESVSKRVLAH